MPIHTLARVNLSLSVLRLRPALSCALLPYPVPTIQRRSLNLGVPLAQSPIVVILNLIDFPVLFLFVSSLHVGAVLRKRSTTRCLAPGELSPSPLPSLLSRLRNQKSSPSALTSWGLSTRVVLMQCNALTHSLTRAHSGPRLRVTHSRRAAAVCTPWLLHFSFSVDPFAYSH